MIVVVSNTDDSVVNTDTWNFRRLQTAPASVSLGFESQDFSGSAVLLLALSAQPLLIILALIY
jgi:hypothetical protein